MSRAQQIARRLALPAAIWAISAAVYAGVAGPRTSGPSPDNHFVHLADSFLHGQLGVLGNRPPGTNDWACYDTETQDVCPPGAFSHPRDSQRWYVSFPPFPAIVILPAVALFGPGLSDTLFWALFAGLAPALLFVILRRLRETDRSQRTVRDDLLLTTLFAFGTVFFFTAVQGAVWFAGHVVGVVMILAYVYCALDARRPALAGLMLGLAFMTRATTAALVLFFAIEAMRISRVGPEPEYGDQPSVARRVYLWTTRVQWRDVLKRWAIFAAPILVIGAIAMWMNEERFENPFEFGHRYLMIRWRGRIETWGLFSYHYLSKNLAVFLASLPWLTAQEPHVIISRHGLALWFTTPALLLALWPRRVDAQMVALYAASAAVAIWNLLYQNSGWVQFGYRFALDYLPLVFVAIALGGRRFGPGFLLALVFAIVVNTFGAITFDRAWQYYDDDGTQERVFQPD
ncbi:glycosyltransferase family 87 protein [Sandaracinus amylolyticus]|uniref:DUF2029 domain-containing protein n=1 Tax=Sandaracinus amylolyticus TaxID=927083 RepID=A0A0F6YNC7_9BACT|nr:glycosyltransferase family 87 protein [Sandaracinus amylolyticus]AKF11260.1 hypothetical protein DB32_008409 [Sandaracinus amylolyticus]